MSGPPAMTQCVCKTTLDRGREMIWQPIMSYMLHEGSAKSQVGPAPAGLPLAEFDPPFYIILAPQTRRQRQEKLVEDDDHRPSRRSKLLAQPNDENSTVSIRRGTSQVGASPD